MTQEITVLHLNYRVSSQQNLLSAAHAIVSCCWVVCLFFVGFFFFFFFWGGGVGSTYIINTNVARGSLCFRGWW